MRARHVSRTWQLYVPCTQYTRLIHHHMYGVIDTYALPLCVAHTTLGLYVSSIIICTESYHGRHVYLTGVIDMYTSSSSILHLFAPACEHTRIFCVFASFLRRSRRSLLGQRPAQTASAGSRARSRALFFSPPSIPISILSSHLISPIPPLAPRVCVVFWGVIARSHCLAALLGSGFVNYELEFRQLRTRVSSIALQP